MKELRKGFCNGLKVGISEEEQLQKAIEINKKIAGHKYSSYELTEDLTEKEEKDEYSLTEYLDMILKQVSRVPLGISEGDYKKYDLFDIDKFNNIKISKQDYEKFIDRWFNYIDKKYDELIRQDED